ncbi:MAG: RHS repeat-associated core domain-containing protein [Owenweeksia sp.]|nr:RHS repeat-associated core domain-containing protein [Owenweeksia sp.]
MFRTSRYSIISPYRFNAKELDVETGNYYYRARYYAPWLCRFINVDSLKDKYPFYATYQYAGISR